MQQFPACKTAPFRAPAITFFFHEERTGGGDGGMVQIIGHRGARALEPENTLRAVARGLECAGWVEVDVRLSREGVPVVIHDATLDRTTDGKGPVRETLLADMRRLDAGKGERIPLLQEVLDRVGHRGGLVVEAKEEAVPAICSLLGSYGLEEVMLVSFHAGALPAARSLLPGLATGLIVSRPEGDPVEMACRAGAGTVLPRQDLLSEGLVRDARGKGIRVIPWTLNTREEVLRAVVRGAEGFATDDPCAAREWVGSRRPRD
ncbi:MAG: glycerophosphodiester phosphodiesterase [Methanomicrobiales archaeon]|nr:glycerophosphodiester phosphodiesterase [Methanomicrobiales archaeon]